MSASAEDGAALQQFCLLAKSAKGAGCASLIGQAIEHPGVFVFGELLDMPSVKEARANSTTRRSAAPYHRPTRPIHTRRPLASQLAGTAAAPHLELLKLFAWGTWTDYKGACPRPVPRRADPPLHVHVHEHERVHCVCTACARAAHHAAPGRSLHAARVSLTRLSHAPLSRASRSGGAGQAAQLPALSEAQASKLKMLSVVTLSTKSKLISYDELMREIEARSPPPPRGAWGAGGEGRGGAGATRGEGGGRRGDRRRGGARRAEGGGAAGGEAWKKGGREEAP